VDIDVLGGLHVVENGVPVAPAAPPARQVLAVLAAHADQMVPVAVLAEELETHAPPEHTRAILHSCVRQLRERLGAAVAPGSSRNAAGVLVQTPGGYLLDTGGGRSDLDEFAREAGAGYRAMARGDFETAARRLRGALGLWKGPAFDGVTPGPCLAERIGELEATRKSVVEQWVEAELALGRHRELRTGLVELSSGAAGVPGPPAAPAGAGSVGDTGWARRRHLHLAGAAPRAAHEPADARRAEPAEPGETYRALADVLRADFGGGSAATTSALRRTLLRGASSPVPAPFPSMA
jgi:hypothetical protein